MAEPGAHWPKGVNPMPWSEMGKLGIDENKVLYWDGERVVTQQRITLRGWEWWFAFFAAGGAAIQAITSVVGLFVK